MGGETMGMAGIATEPLLRLMQLVSPALPVGGFAYSQGLEWAVEAGWIRTAGDLEAWLADQLEIALGRLDLPLLIRMQGAVEAGDAGALARWIDWLLAARETSELRAEEVNRGRALADLLAALDLPGAGDWRPLLARSQAAGFAFAAAAWDISPRTAALGYVWAWLENLVLAGVKLVPLGQTQGQRILKGRIGAIPILVDRALDLGDQDIGAASPALAIAAGAHETQYTRLFRS
ncbi:MAG: urease accessory protein UreF [Candidatus Thiosymbion ectosymbiont of Robbea hypermnestra]|nr:urease accessory protein UreF [Candidatus Thiosymbion ectosymbiont of Robbea hypermnestra]